MTGKVEYLERYSVAPSPSRDYYGLKILRDEVILCIWRISHGPHKTPILRRSKFFEFDQDKALQEDISRIFGGHFVNYVKSIASGKGNTLLTLPRSSIKRIVGYLKLKDIVNLSTLSRIANVVFNDNIVWEALYKRHERFRISRAEREYAMAYGWKQAFKEKQMVLHGERRKTTGSTTKREKSKVQPTTTRPSSGSLKVGPEVSNLSVNANTSRSMQAPEKNTATSLIKSLNETDIEAVVRSIQADKKSIKKASTARQRQTQNTKSSKSEKSNVQMVESKHNIREAFSDSMTATQKSAGTQRGKLRKSSVSAKTASSRVKVTDKGKVGDSRRNLSTSKSNLGSIKSNEGEGGGGGGGGAVVDRRDRSKSRSKSKNKTKKSTQNKSSTMSNVDKSFLNESAAVLGNENYELAFLIEESLKRLRSPRTVFDYDFSYLEGSRTLVNVTKKPEESRKGTSTNEASKARDQASARQVDRLSEHSDSLDTPSSQSTRETRRQEIDDKKSKRSVTDSKVSTVRSEMLDRIVAGDLFETISKESPKANEDTFDIKASFSRGALNSIDIMKAFRSANPATKSTATSGKGLTSTTSITATPKNRFAVKKSLDESRKDRLINKNK